MGSFMIWMSTCGRKKIKAEHPDYKVTEVASLGGKIWHQMSNEDKFVWKKKAALARSDYSSQLQLYVAKNPRLKASGAIYKRGRARPLPKVSIRRNSMSEPAIAGHSSTVIESAYCHSKEETFSSQFQVSLENNPQMKASLTFYKRERTRPQPKVSRTRYSMSEPAIAGRSSTVIENDHFHFKEETCSSSGYCSFECKF